MLHFKNIIEKFFTPSLSVILIGVVIISSNMAWLLPTISSLRKSVADIENATVRIALSQIEGFLDAKENDVAMYASFLRGDLSHPENTILLERLLQKEYFVNVALVDVEGKEVVKYDKFKTIFPENLGNVFDRADFKEVLRTGRISWSHVIVSENFEPLIILNLPVFSSSKEIAGVLSATVNVSPILRAVGGFSAKDGKIYVVDREGILISDPDISLVLKRLDYSGRRIVEDALSVPHGVVFSYDDRYTYDNKQGVKVLAVAAKIPKTGWVVVFEESKMLALSNLTKLEVFAFTSLLVVSFLLFLMRKVNLKVVQGRIELEKNLLLQKELLKRVEESKKNIETVNAHLKEKDSKLGEKVIELENFQKFTLNREIRMIELKGEIKVLKQLVESLQSNNSQDSKSSQG